MHRLLKRQLKNFGLDETTAPNLEAWQKLLERVSQTYSEGDQDKSLLERSLTISSREMEELYDNLRQKSEAHIDELMKINQKLLTEIVERDRAEVALQEAHDELEMRVDQRTAELQKANEQLATLYKIGQTITAPLHLNIVLNVIARSTADLLGTDTGVILLVDEATQTLSIKGAYGLSKQVVLGTRDRIGESIAGRVAQTGEPIIANDLPNDPRFYNPASSGEGLLACASTPLALGRKIIGTLDVHSKQDRYAFNQEHIRLLNMLASQAAIAIENARLYEELRTAHDELEMRVQQRTAELTAVNERLIQVITERKQADKALQKQHAFLQQVIDINPHYIFAKDRNGRFTLANLSFAKAYWSTVEELLGKTDADFSLSREQVEKFRRDDEAVIDLQKDLFTPEERIVKADGEVHWRQTIKRPIVGEDGITQQVLGVVTDITELKRAEERLELTQFSVDNAADAVFWIGEEAQFLYVNQTACRLLAYSGEELLTMTFYDIDHNYPLEVWHTHWKTTQRSPVTVESYFRSKDNQTFPVEVTFTYLEFGDKAYNLVFAHDITSRRWAAQALQESEERFRQVISSISVHVYMRELTKDGQQINRYLSPTQDLTGYPPEKFEDNWRFWSSNLVHPNDRGIVAIQTEQFTKGQDCEVEYRLIRADGNIIWVRDNGRVKQDSASQNIIIYGVVNDVTERRRIEEERIRFTNQLRTAADVSRQISAILDPDLLLEEVSCLLQERYNLYHVHVYLLDETTGELIMQAGSGEAGLRLREQGHRITLGSEQSLVARSARSREIVLVNDVSADPGFLPNPLLPETKAEVAVPLIAGDKVMGVFDVQDNHRHRFSQVDLDTYSTLAGQIAIALENAHLFEEQKQASEALAYARDKALEGSRLKSQILAKVSHELRTPLGAILGYTELLQNGIFGPLSDQQVEVADEVIDSTHYLTSLVSELLDQAQLEAGKLELNIISFAPAEIMNQVQSKMSVLAQAKRLTLNAIIDPDIPAALSGDPKRLQQILVNLVSNAIKFTEDGIIQVRFYRPDPAHWAMQVTDTGPGIPAEAQSDIFEPFQQVDGSATREQKGTGLGLSIVKQLATAMGGQITLNSRLGQGSTFTVLLPLTPVQEKTE